jgi:hypothetical protein
MTNSPDGCSAASRYADLMRELHSAADEYDRGHGPLHAAAANAIQHLETLLQASGPAQVAQVPIAWFCEGDPDIATAFSWKAGSCRSCDKARIPVYTVARIPDLAQAVSEPSEEDLAVAMFEARHHGLTNIMPWDDIDHDGRDYWRTIARNLMRTHRVVPVSQCSADTEDELGLYDLGESFLAEYERATKDGCLKNFVCAESPVEVLWHLINEVDELRLEIDQLRAIRQQAVKPAAWMSREHIEAYMTGNQPGVAWASPQQTDFFDVALYAAGAIERAAVADQIIGQIEERFPNWRSYRDLIDCIDCTLR